MLREVSIDHHCIGAGCVACIQLNALSKMAKEQHLIFKFILPPSPAGLYTGHVYSQRLPLLRRIKTAVWSKAQAKGL